MAKRHVLLAIWLASFAPIPSASAEEFPSRPITWVVPFAPGGITDTTSRIVAEEMARTLGQSVVIDNRAGGGGAVGTEQVARARPDGYTMIYGTQGTMAANVTLRKNLSYDPLTSFLPVHLVGESPNLLVAYHGAPYNSVSEFVAYAKQNPGKVTFSSSGVGTATHLVAELFKTVTGIEMQHVPYRGSAPALNDMIAGRVDVMFDYPVSVGPHVEAGKLKVLATTAPERLRAFPDVPTMAELGKGDDHPELVIDHGAGRHARAGRRPAGRGCACGAIVGARAHAFRKGRHPPHDAAEGRDDPVHRKGDQALGRCDRTGGAGEAVVFVSLTVGPTREQSRALRHLARHARPCAGHPRLCFPGARKDVDGRDKPGHDEGEGALSPAAG
jgi:tripartite-type tricarboxylate transporter receptor subunit TctC